MESPLEKLNLLDSMFEDAGRTDLDALQKARNKPKHAYELTSALSIIPIADIVGEDVVLRQELREYVDDAIARFDQVDADIKEHGAKIRALPLIRAV